jgi:Tol biopolymer transport system component/DNA-binding winged helix-turn-helix (wHTH) protein
MSFESLKDDLKNPEDAQNGQKSSYSGFYEFGQFRLYAAKRLLLRHGIVVPLTPKAFDILLLLVSRHGYIVGKDELLRDVWPDTIVEENNLNVNVSLLRKTLGEKPNDHQFIVTVPGKGYQFVSEVRFIRDEEAKSTEVSSSAVSPALASLVANETEPRAVKVIVGQFRGEQEGERLSAKIKRHKTALVMILSGLMISTAAVVYVSHLMNQRSGSNLQAAQRSLSRLTFDAGLQSEPTWSPDGRFIAYSSDKSGNFDIWVQFVGGGDAVQVTHSPAHDWQPDWSPDGSQIVFRSERDGAGLYTVPVLGGHEQKISSFGYRPRWSPDGSQVLFTDMWQGVGLLNFKVKLYVARPGGGEPREVLADFTRDPIGVYSFAWHPDGQRITILRADGFWTTPLQGGAPVKSEIIGDICPAGEFHWARAGDVLYFQGLSQEVKNLWKVEVDSQSLRWRGHPERLTTGAGQDTDIALSPDGRRLAFTTRVEDVQVWSLPFDARNGKLAGEGQPVTAAGIIPWFLDLTRDGKKLVFIAWRTGTQKKELWEKSLADGSERLLTVREYPFFSPRWSRDGTRVAYQLPTWIISDPKVDPATVILPVNRGDELKLTSGKGGDGLPFDWSADGRWVLAGSDLGKPGQNALVLLPVAAAPHAEAEARVVVSDAERMLFEGHFSPDDRWICFNAVGRGGSTVYVVGATGGKWVRITEENGWADKPRWSPDGRAIYYISRRGTGFLNVWKVEFDPLKGEPLGEPIQVTSYQSPAKGIWPDMGPMEMSLSADRLVLPIQEVTGSIWVLDGVDR